MSPKLVTVGRNWDNLTKQQQTAAKSAIVSINAMQKRADKFISSTLKWGAALAGSAIGLGFAEAFNLEGYRSQLETATKDTQRAAEVMSYSINLANVTPFEGGEMASAAAALEMASLKTETYLTTLGDTAAGANRKISEVQSGFIKAFSTGDITEFLKSINVSSAAFKEFTRENKLSTSSLEDTQVALKRFLDERFGGGMAKLATTTKGAWSTITGVTKSALAQIVGMGTDGTVRVGSALDFLRGKAVDFSNLLVQYQQDGTIQHIAEEVGGVLSMVWDIGERVFSTLYKYKELVGGFMLFAGAIWAIEKAMTAYKTITAVAAAVTKLFGGALAATPVGVIATILGLVGAGVLWASTADEATAANKDLVNSIDELDRKQNGNGQPKNTSNGLLTDEQLKKAKNLRNKADQEEGFMGWFGHAVAAGYEIKSFLGNVGKAIGDAGSAFISSFSSNQYANGTQYHTGGVALVGERGPELVELPSGSRVTTAERTAKARGQVTVNNYITINGAERSDEEIADMVARRIIEETEYAW